MAENEGIQFEDNRAKVMEAMAEKAVAFLLEAVAELQSQTARNSRVDTGQTKGSWDTHVDEASLEAMVGSARENAIWEEFGTGEYALNGNGRKTPWVYTDRKGETHFTHGKKPNRALWNAFQTLKPKLIKKAEALMKELNGND